MTGAPVREEMGPDSLETDSSAYRDRLAIVKIPLEVIVLELQTAEFAPPPLAHQLP